MKDKLLIWLIIVGLGIAYIGIKYQNPIIVGLAIGGAGAYGIFAGFQMIISKHAEVPTSGGRSAHKDYHTGIAAQLWGRNGHRMVGGRAGDPIAWRTKRPQPDSLGLRA